MSKGGLALSSLVIAIPAGLLAYLSIRSAFEMNESMPLPVTIIVWTLIVLSVLLAISPIIFIIAGPSGAATVSPPAASVAVADAKQKPARRKTADDEFSDDGDGSEADSDNQLFDASDAEAGAEDFEDNFNFDDEEEVVEDEPAPKKKKKK